MEEPKKLIRSKVKKKIKRVARRPEKKRIRPKLSLAADKKESAGQTGAEKKPSIKQIDAQVTEAKGEEIAMVTPVEQQIEDQADLSPADNPVCQQEEEKGQTIPLESASREIELLGFYLADEEYTIDIGSIKEIIKPVEITEVPRIATFIKGIISLRGLIIPVFDLREKISLEDRAFTKNSRIIVVSINESIIGLMVDSVTEVIRLKEEEIEPPPTTVSFGDAEYIKGVGRYKGRMVILLDLERVLKLEESLSPARTT